MESWYGFSHKEPELSEIGKHMLFPTQPHVGLAFLATIRKDGGPRLHPISLVYAQGHLYVFIPHNSPKCGDLLRDGRYALQAFPPPDNVDGKEFYLTGVSQCAQDSLTRQKIIAETAVHVEENEDLFEFFISKAIYTMLADQGTLNEHPVHRIWPARA